MPASTRNPSPPTVPSHPNMGAQVRLISKGNEGKRAWRDTTKGDTAKMTYVLIEDIVGGSLRSTRVYKSSVAPMHETPRTRFEAMIQQKPDIETAINAIVKKIAKCKVGGNDELKNYIGKKVDDELARLIASGNMNWTEVRFGESDEHEERVRAAEQAAADAEREATAARMEAAVQARAARAAEAVASREARRRTALQEDMERMAAELSRMQAEFARERQRSQEVESRAQQAEAELEEVQRAQVEAHFDEMDMMEHVDGSQ